MADKILYDIFYGNVNELDKNLNLTKQQNRSIEKESKLHDELYNQLNDEQKKLFVEYVETQDLNICDEVAFRFVNGVKLGLRIGLLEES